MAYVSIIDFQWFASFLHLFFKITLYIAIRSVTWNIATSPEQKYALNHFSDPFSFSFFQPPPFFAFGKEKSGFWWKKNQNFQCGNVPENGDGVLCCALTKFYYPIWALPENLCHSHKTSMQKLCSTANLFDFQACHNLELITVSIIISKLDFLWFGKSW